MKKVLSIVMLAMLTMGVFGGCGKVETPAAGDSEVKEETPVEETEADEKLVEEEPEVEETEASVEEEIMANMTTIESAVINWLDIATSSDTSYTLEDRLMDYVDKKVSRGITDVQILQFSTEFFMTQYEKINGYEIKKLELIKDSQKAYENGYIVDFDLEIDLEFEEGGEKKTETFSKVISGTYIDDVFSLNGFYWNGSN